MSDKEQSLNPNTEPEQPNDSPLQLSFDGFDEDVETIETEGEFDGELITVRIPKRLYDTLDKFKGVSDKLVPEPLKDLAAMIVPQPQPDSINPDQHIMINTPIYNELMGAQGKKPINAGGHDVTIIPAQKRQPEITTYFITTLDTEKGTSSLSAEEREISDAIISIFEQARKEGRPATFTADSLYNAMPGSGERASPQQKKTITGAVDKFRHLEHRIDATDEMQRRGLIGDNDTYVIEDFYLKARKHIYKADNGQNVTGWEITEEPIFLTNAKQTKQIITVPARYLTITKVKQNKASSEPIMMNAARQAITGYMLRRIAIMKHDLDEAITKYRNYNRRRKKDNTQPEYPLSHFRTQSDTILFKTLFEETRTTTTDRKQEMRNRNFCFDVLDYWTAAGYIKGYTKQTKGRSITGVHIDLQ